LICFGEETHAFGLYRPPSVILSSLPLHAINRNATETDEKAVAMVSRKVLSLSPVEHSGKTHRYIHSLNRNNTDHFLKDFIGKT
jgi:hypothetical protein